MIEQPAPAGSPHSRTRYFARGGLGLALVASLALTVPACGTDPEEELRRLPIETAELLRRGEIGDAVECLAEDFTAHGLDRAQVILYLTERLHNERLLPYVVEVLLHPAETGLEERSLIVLGLLVEGEPSRATRRTMEPFRIEARVRCRDEVWEVTSAHLVR
ncbi:MAG: hypothetical protein AB1486_18585 [Planctomycetota bacterium]